MGTAKILVNIKNSNSSYLSRHEVEIFKSGSAALVITIKNIINVHFEKIHWRREFNIKKYRNWNIKNSVRADFYHPKLDLWITEVAHDTRFSSIKYNRGVRMSTFIISRIGYFVRWLAVLVFAKKKWKEWNF